MIRRCDNRDFETILAIINDGARAYEGIIPADRWNDPYMSRAKLKHEIESGVTFWGYEEGKELLGVMGLQEVRDVALIRHAYVPSGNQKRGVGGHLLTHLRGLTLRPVLIGTWADATWAIRFYEKFGFEKASALEKERLLKQYWNVPSRQVETSVVLVDQRWKANPGRMQ